MHQSRSYLLSQVERERKNILLRGQSGLEDQGWQAEAFRARVLLIFWRWAERASRRLVVDMGKGQS